MAEYIEREALRTAVKNKATTKYDWSEEIDFEDFEKVLDSIPAVDVAPVVHSGWEITDVDHAHGGKCYHCPECGEDEWRYDAANYCPNCGANMKDGE